MRESFYEFIRRYMENNTKSRNVQRIVGFSDWLLRVYWNERNWTMERNGEALLVHTAVEYFKDAKPYVLFDIGANIGDYTGHLMDVAPDAEAHLFELVPTTAEKVTERFKDCAGVKVNPFGLSNEEAEVEVTIFPDDMTQSRIGRVEHKLRGELQTCRVRPGDAYVRESGVDYIHHMKIDTEGHENSVFQGLHDTIRDGKIGIIQFEYGNTYFNSRTYLRDNLDILHAAGFKTGRQFPKGIWFREFESKRDENFRNCNYVAVHESHPELIKAVSLPG